MENTPQLQILEQPESLEQHEKQPSIISTKDSFEDPTKLLSTTFFLLGLSQLLTWNLFIKSVPYITSKFPKLEIPNVSGIMSFAYTLANFITTLTIVLIRWDELIFKRIAPKIVFGFSLSLLVMTTMIVVIFLTNLNIFSPIQLLKSGAICFAIGGFTAAILTKSIFSLLARFPPILTPFMLSGQALSGITTSLTNLGTNIISLTSSDSSWTASLNFILGSIIIFVTLSLFIVNWKKKNSDFNYFYITTNTIEDDLNEDDLNEMAEVSSLSSNIEINDFENQKKHQRKKKRITFTNLMMVCNIMWKMGLSISLTFFASVSIFSTFIVVERSWKDEHLFFDSTGNDGFLITFVKSYYQSFTFFVYDIGDFIGRSLPGFVEKFKKECERVEGDGIPSRWVQWGPFIRVLVLFSSFYYLHIAGDSLSPAIKDFLNIIAILIMGLSNGLMVSMAFLQSSSLVKYYSHNDPCNASQKQEASGSLLGLFLNFGILMGSTSNFVWKMIL